MPDSLPMLPPPEDPVRSAEPSSQDRSGHRQKKAQPRSKRRAKLSYPTEHECMAALAQLSGLVALGYLSTSKANAIRGVYAEMLRWHKSAQRGGQDRRLDDEGLLSLLRTNPELLHLVEPLLTDDQIDLVTGAADEEEEETGEENDQE